MIVVRGGDELRGTIAHVYEALGLPVRPEVAGAIADGHPGIATEQIQASILQFTRNRLEAELTTIVPDLSLEAERLMTTLSGRFRVADESRSQAQLSQQVDR